MESQDYTATQDENACNNANEDNSGYSSPIAPRFLMLNERGIKRNRMTNDKFVGYCKKVKRDGFKGLYDKHRRSFIAIDKYLFNLVKTSVASRHFFLYRQDMFGKKLTDYVKKLSLSDELQSMNVSEEYVLEFIPMCLPEYWEQYHNVINSLRFSVRGAINNLEREFQYPTRKRDVSTRARCLTRWFQKTSDVALKLEYAMTGTIPEEIEVSDTLRLSVTKWKGFRHELVEQFKEAVEKTYEHEFLTFEELDETQVDHAIRKLTVAQKKDLARSRFCFIWCIASHSGTKLAKPGATIQRFDKNIRLSLEVFLMQNLYMDLWCSKCQDKMWLREDDSSPLLKLVNLVHRDRTTVDKALLQRSLDVISEYMPTGSSDLMYDSFVNENTTLCFGGEEITSIQEL